MGAATDTLSDSIRQTIDNPLIIAVAVVAVLVGGLIAGVLSLIPIVGQLLSAPVVAVFMAGIVGMAYVGARDQTSASASVSDYTATLSEHGTTVFLASLLKNVAVGVLLVVAGIVFLVVPIFVVGLGSAGASQPAADPGAFGALLAGASVLFLLFFFLWVGVLLLAQTLFQFVDSAIVIGGKDVTGSLSESIDLFTESPGSVIAFSVLRGLLFLGMVVVVALASFVGSQIADSLGVVFAAIGLLVGYPTVGTVALVYEARYYMQRRPDAAESEETPTQGGSQATRQTQ
jgi:hypothetical protein